MVTTPSAQETSIPNPRQTASPTKFDFSSEAFKSAIAGEWFGHEVSFSPRTGLPLQIPDRYIPDAFREWGVDINAFECLTSSTVLSEGTLLVKRTRALPTVGCEADAIIPEVRETEFSVRDERSLNGGFSDGCVSCGPIVLEMDSRFQAVLVDPQDTKSRVRVDFGRVDEKVGRIDVFFENWQGAFCGGQVLPGCGGGSQSFADEKRLNPEHLQGNWSVERQSYKVGDENLTEGEPFTVSRQEMSDISIALPRGLSVDVTLQGDGRDVVVGWLRGDQRLIVRRQYDSDGKLLSVSREFERKK